MFSNRHASTSGSVHGDKNAASGRLFKRMSVLTLAVSMAVPSMPLMALAQSAQSTPSAKAPVNQPVLAADAVQPAASAPELLKQGVEQYNRKEYEEAVATLQQVDPTGLDAAGKAQLTQIFASAQSAADQRKAARAAFEKGEQLLATDPAGALKEYRAAANNPFVDAGTRDKAVTQAALAEADLKTRGQAVPAVPATPAAPSTPAVATNSPEASAAYADGKAAYDRGDMATARAQFAKAASLGYAAGTMEMAPEKYLQSIQAKEQLDALRNAREAIGRLEQEKAKAEREQAEAAAKAAAAAQANAANQNTTPANPAAPATPATPSTPAIPLSPVPTAPVAQDTQPAPAAPTAPKTDAGPAGLADAAAAERLRLIQNQQTARQLTERGDQALAAGSLTEATELYTQALQLDPGNQRAQVGRQQALSQSGTNPVQQSIAAREEARIRAVREAIQYRFDTAIAVAEESIRTGQFDNASAALQNAQVAAGSNPTVFSGQELQNFDARISQVRANLTTTQQAAAEQAARTQRDQAITESNRRQAETEAAKRETVATLTRDARRLSDQGRWEEALGVVEQILNLDRQNDYAIGVRPLLVDRIQIARQRQYREKTRENIIDTFTDVEEKKIPYSDILTFPPDWPDLSARRDRTVAEERGGTAEDQQVAAVLGRTLPELRFDQVPFTDVITFLADSTQANIFVNWRALEAAAIDRNTPVSIRLRNVKFSKVLRTILDEVGGGTVRLGYTIDEGVITISTQEDLAQNVDTRVYDIRDLIISIPDFEAPDFDIGSGNNGGGNGGGGIGGGGNGGGGGGGNLFGGNGNGNGNNNNNENQGPTRAELVEQIIQLIQETIASDTWRENGGTIGSVRELGGQLIVTQTPENQLQLARLLAQLRETRAIQVSIEARFLTVSRNFLEDVGIDFDFTFNNGSNNPAINNNLNGVIPGRTGIGPVTVNQNSINFTQPSALDTGVAGNLGGSFANPNLSTTISAFLDDFQATLLIRATQGARNLTTLTAPRVTLFNGQRAFVEVATLRSYVSDLEPIVGQNSVGFDPVISTLPTGVLLDVQATVSADRKYVTLTLQPQLYRLLSLQTFPVFSGQTNGGGDNGNGNGGNDGVVTGTGFIQQPEIEVTRVQTTVSVPDGGTLLLGGQTVAGEIDREAGVPVLSKVPFLKRLFTNRSMARDESVLLILVKPTIIIQKEVEAANYPTIQPANK